MSDKKHKLLPGWKEFIIVLIAISFLSYVLLRLGEMSRKIALKEKARAEMATIIAAISNYQTTYGRLPLYMTNYGNFTFGTYGTSAESVGITNHGSSGANNSAIMAAIMDLTRFENGSPTVNSNHCHNPQRIVFLNVRHAAKTNEPGLGPDGVYRDPWGNPYIITLNYCGDSNCLDAFYRWDAVSANPTNPFVPIGLTGLERLFGTFTNLFVAHTQIMVWSLGPDGEADFSQKADQGVNKDNITSW